MKKTKKNQPSSEIDRKGELIAKEIKHHRAKCGLSRPRLSQKAGVSVYQIRRLEIGEGKPTLLVCLKLAAALNISLSEVLLKIE